MVNPILIYSAAVLVGLAVVAGALRHASKKFRLLVGSKKTFLQNILRALGNIDHGFDALLALDGAKVLGFDNGELTAQLKTPLNLSHASCLAADEAQEGADADGEIGVGAVLALADVFTTLALLAGDADHRPGVSITLTGELFKKISVGQQITIKAKILKIGSILGFTEMWIYNQANEPLARAKHIKYLQMGFIWDMFGFLLPLIVNVYNYKKGKHSKSHQKGPSQQSEMASVMSSSVSKRDSDPLSWYHVRKHNSFLNFYGFMHGGAICCLLELCVLDSFRQAAIFPAHDDSSSTGNKNAKGAKNKLVNDHYGDTLKYLEVSFLSPCKGALEVGIEHHTLGDRQEGSTELSSTGSKLPIGSVAGRIYAAKDKKKARVLVEASYSF